MTDPRARAFPTAVSVGLFCSLAACSTVSTAVDHDTTFTADGHPQLRGSRSGCNGVSGSRTVARTELYLGTSRPDGVRITDDQYRRFIDVEVTPRFGDSLVLLSGHSQIAAKDGKLVREPSQVLVLLYSTGEERNAAVEEIRRAFRKEFQGAMMPRVDSRACVVF